MVLDASNWLSLARVIVCWQCGDSAYSRDSAATGSSRDALRAGK